MKAVVNKVVKKESDILAEDLKVLKKEIAIDSSPKKKPLEPVEEEKAKTITNKRTSKYGNLIKATLQVYQQLIFRMKTEIFSQIRKE